MYFLSVLFFIVLYILLARMFVKFITNRTDNKICKWLALAFVVLLPTWDVVLGYLVYYPACLFIPKVAIYETAETDGIYYEGIHDYVFKLEAEGRNDSEEELTQIGSIYNVFHYGYTFAESKVTAEKVNYKKKKIAPIIYRCTPLPKDEQRPAFQRTSCVVVTDIKSQYTVRETNIEVGISNVALKKIYNRTTGKLMAEYNQVRIFSFFPFFDWLDWAEGRRIAHCSPDTPSYKTFEFTVLKPKNRG